MFGREFYFILDFRPFPTLITVFVKVEIESL